MAKNFGYTVQVDASIDYDHNDRRVARFLEENEPSINLCIGCGSCTATCSTGQFTSFNIRRLHTFTRRGEIRNLKQELQKCMFCGKCQLICPRGVNLRNVIIILNRAIEHLG